MKTEQPQPTDVCQNCNKTIHSHFGGNHHCDNGFGGPDPNRHFTPSPSPAAQSGSVDTANILQEMSREVYRLGLENKELRDQARELKKAIGHSGTLTRQEFIQLLESLLSTDKIDKV